MHSGQRIKLSNNKQQKFNYGGCATASGCTIHAQHVIFSSSATIIISAGLFLHFIDLYRGSIKRTFHNLSEELIFQETDINMRIVSQNQTFRKESLIAS